MVAAFMAALAVTIIWGAALRLCNFHLLNNPFASLVGAALFGAALMLPERFRAAGAVSVAVGWFSLALAEVWLRTPTDGYILAGLLPFSDAQNYLFDASRLIEGHDLSGWGSRRPLASLYLGGWLGLADSNLQFALALMSAAGGAALGLAGLELRRHLGVVATALFAWLVFLFFRRFTGVFSSECGGLTWGLAALALLLAGARRRSVPTVATGLAALSIALNVRAGALLVLPALLLWLGWEFRASRRQLALLSLSGGLAMLVGFVASSATVHAAGAKDGLLFSNYAQTLYGLVFDGDWTKAYHDHPEINAMSERERTLFLYHIIGDTLAHEPAKLARGVVRAWIEFLTRPHSGLSPYDFILNLYAEAVVYALAACGAIALLWRARHDLATRFIIGSSIGIFASVALVPTRDADNMRAYAATIPLIVLLPCAAPAAAEAWFRRRSGRLPEAPKCPAPYLSWCCLACLAFVSFGIAPLCRFVVPRRSLAEFPQPGSLAWRQRSGTYINVTAQMKSVVGLPNTRPGNLARGITAWIESNHPGLARFIRDYDHDGVILASSGSNGAGALVLDARHLHDSAPVIIHGVWVKPIASYIPFFIESSLLEPPMP